MRSRRSLEIFVVEETTELKIKLQLKIKLPFVDHTSMVVRVGMIFISRAFPLILILICPLNMHLILDVGPFDGN